MPRRAGLAGVRGGALVRHGRLRIGTQLLQPELQGPLGDEPVLLSGRLLAAQLGAVADFLDLAVGRALPNEFADDDLDQDCLRVVKSLKRPAIEPEARDFLVIAHAGFDHLEGTGFAGAPVTVDADRQRVLAIFFEQRDDRFGNSLS